MEIKRAIENAKTVSRPCTGRECLGAVPNILDYTPYESELLNYNVKYKLTDIKGRKVGPESGRIQSVMLATYDNSVSQFDIFTRFAQYAPRVVLPVCPPVDLIDRNANLPKASTRCPIPRNAVG